MHPVAAYHYFGLIASVILVCGLGFIIWKWPEGKQYTFSQHVALHRHRILYYILLFSVVLPLLILFFVGWFVPTFRLSEWVNLFIIISALTQFACTLIPEVSGWKTKYHRLLAGISALALMPTLSLLLTSDAVTTIAKTVTGACLGAMLVVVYLAVKGKGSHSHSLYLQIGYFAAFLAPVLFIAYVG